MSISYQYVPGTVPPQSPSAAPGAGVLPTSVLPVSGEAGDSNSLYQALKTNTDFISHIQTAINMDVPTVATGTSPLGYTDVSHVGTGTGTVTPSGSATAQTSANRFVVKIILGGAVGTATFQMSLDGGTTYGSTTATAATVTVAPTNIVVAFSGTFVANDTYAFRGQYAPLAFWQPLAGFNRHLIDHWGYPTGRITQFREDWCLKPQNITAAGTTYFAGDRLYVAINGTTGAYNGPIFHSTDASDSGLFATTALGTPSGDYIALGTAQAIAAGPGLYPYFAQVLQTEVYIPSFATTNKSYYLGFSANGLSTGTEYVWFRASAGTANWQCETHGSSTTTVDSGVAVPNAVIQRMRIEWSAGSSPEGVRASFFINEKAVASITTNLPTATARFTVMAQMINTALSSGSQNFNIGPLLYTCNRMQSTPAL